MTGCIGLRREDKNRWERRVPLTPSQIRPLVDEQGIEFVVQPSPIRVFTDDRYVEAGATVDEDLSRCRVVMAVKEIPERLLEAGRTYVYFSHTIKGQPYNMSMLARLMELGCTLVDYELIVDGSGRRTVFFGVHAGMAGMVETLVALGRRLAAEGMENPFERLRPPHEYPDLAAVERSVASVGEEIARAGLPGAISPLVFGFAGYGNVSRGAQRILDLLPVEQVAVEDLASIGEPPGPSRRVVHKVVFEERHMVAPVEAGRDFVLDEYYEHPERYRGVFEEHLPHLDVLVNCIFWTERYPRLVTRQGVARLAQESTPRLRVIGDVSCDIDGAVEFTVKATMPDEPCFTWNPRDDGVVDGIRSDGIVVMAVDNLPCELPREASESFGEALTGLVPPMARADWTRDVTDLGLPREIEDAIIVHRGALRPRFEYLESIVDEHGRGKKE